MKKPELNSPRTYWPSFVWPCSEGLDFSSTWEQGYLPWHLCVCHLNTGSSRMWKEKMQIYAPGHLQDYNWWSSILVAETVINHSCNCFSSMEITFTCLSVNKSLIPEVGAFTVEGVRLSWVSEFSSIVFIFGTSPLVPFSIAWRHEVRDSHVTCKMAKT